VILGIATASRAGSVALGDLAGGRMWSTALGEPATHAENLLPACEELLSRAGATWDAVDLVAVDVGPGSFTGIRVGVAAALGVAEARGIAAVGVGSLDILADACYHAIQPAPDSYMICAADVRRGEVVWAAYRPGPGGPRAETPERLAPVADPGSEPPAGAILAADPGVKPWPGRGDLVRWVAAGAARAEAVVRTGARLRGVESTSPPEPRYARPADAKPAAERRAAGSDTREDGKKR